MIAKTIIELILFLIAAFIFLDLYGLRVIKGKTSSKMKPPKGWPLPPENKPIADTPQILKAVKFKSDDLYSMLLKIYYDNDAVSEVVGSVSVWHFKKPHIRCDLETELQLANIYSYFRYHVDRVDWYHVDLAKGGEIES